MANVEVNGQLIRINNNINGLRAHVNNLQIRESRPDEILHLGLNAFPQSAQSNESNRKIDLRSEAMFPVFNDAVRSLCEVCPMLAIACVGITEGQDWHVLPNRNYRGVQEVATEVRLINPTELINYNRDVGCS